MVEQTIKRALLDSFEKAQNETINQDRITVLTPLINYIQKKLEAKEPVNLNFICTHNSRRSQFSQIWAFTAACYNNIPVNCFSGGVEVTEFNQRAVDSLIRSGFTIKKQGENNPKYTISVDTESKISITAFSKLYDDPLNSVERFAAIMTCSHADENCPIIPNAELRIPIKYEDPKSFDNTSLEKEMYDARSLQIASEMLYIFSKINNSK